MGKVRKYFLILILITGVITMSDAGAGPGGGISEAVFNVDEGMAELGLATDIESGEVSLAPGATGMESPGSPGSPGAVEGGGLTPITPAVTPAVAEAPKTTPKAPAIERKRRRRSLLSQEEGGLAEDGAIQRRSILGR